MKYRKKPVVIEARQVGENFYDDMDTMVWCGGEPIPKDSAEILAVLPASERPVWLFSIPTLEGPMMVSPFDWVIRGVEGEFYPCKPSVFEVSYEAVS